MRDFSFYSLLILIAIAVRTTIYHEVRALLCVCHWFKSSARLILPEDSFLCRIHHQFSILKLVGQVEQTACISRLFRCSLMVLVNHAFRVFNFPLLCNMSEEFGCIYMIRLWINSITHFRQFDFRVGLTTIITVIYLLVLLDYRFSNTFCLTFRVWVIVDLGDIIETRFHDIRWTWNSDCFRRHMLFELVFSISSTIS